MTVVCNVELVAGERKEEGDDNNLDGGKEGEREIEERKERKYR